MTEQANNQDMSRESCEAFQAQLPELIGSGESLADHPHLHNCELCRALLAELETIADAARKLFPIEEPSDDLWEQIESKIKNEAPAEDTPPPPEEPDPKPK
jgi:hypothetical protein